MIQGDRQGIPSSEATLSDDKWVRIMCDFCADGLWAKDGAAVGPDELPVSDAIKERLRAWQDVYESREMQDGGEFGPLPPDFSEQGLAIAKAIKDELPDWTVVYFDELRCNRVPGVTQPRIEFEYEVKP